MYRNSVDKKRSSVIVLTDALWGKRNTSDPSPGKNNKNTKKTRRLRKTNDKVCSWWPSSFQGCIEAVVLARVFLPPSPFCPNNPSSCGPRIAGLYALDPPYTRSRPALPPTLLPSFVLREGDGLGTIYLASRN